MYKPMLRLLPCAACVVLVFSASGCDSDVPAASTDGRDFTLWGQLDPTTNRQAVRVEPISPTLGARLDIDGQVVSEDRTTGEITTWRDSVVTYPDGSAGHIFLADYRPAYDSPVEFRVEQEGETVTYARVTVPPNVTPIFGDLESGIRNQLDLLLPGAPRVVGARVIYDIAAGPRGEAPGYTEVVVVEPQNLSSIEFGWRVRVDFTRQVEVLRNRFLQREIRQFNATGIRVQVTVANEEWAAPFPFNFSREILIQPGTVSNVRGGYGFLGAAYTTETEWMASEDDLQRIGL